MLRVRTIGGAPPPDISYITEEGKMKKLRLEDLAVESFVVSERASGRGTVAANEATTGCPPGTNLCTEMEESCDEICGASHPYQRVCQPMTYEAC